MKKRKVIKKIFKYLAIGFLLLIAYFIGESTYENIRKKSNH